MKKLLLALILLLPTGSFAHNVLTLDVDSITNSDIFIRQVESHLEMWGTSSGNNFQIVGDNISVNIDMQSTDSGCCNYVTGGFISNSNSSLIIKLADHGSDHLVNLDYDYSGTSNYHNVDVDISGTGQKEARRAAEHFEESKVNSFIHIPTDEINIHDQRTWF